MFILRFNENAKYLNFILENGAVIVNDWSRQVTTLLITNTFYGVIWFGERFVIRSLNCCTHVCKRLPWR